MRKSGATVLIIEDEAQHRRLLRTLLTKNGYQVVEAETAAGGLADLRLRQVTKGGKEVHLTPIEYKLLTTLIKCEGRVMTHEQLLKEVWGPSCSEQSQYLRVYMGQLRSKLETSPHRPKFLITEPGVGYRLRAER